MIESSSHLRADGDVDAPRAELPSRDAGAHGTRRDGYAFGLLDPLAKREIRRSCFKALCIPGYQVPFSSRELPMASGFGTGGTQITLASIGPDDTLKVIDQGADESVNACAIRQLVRDVCPGVTDTTSVTAASLIQTRHRIPEAPLREDQLMVYQVPYPDPLSIVEPSNQRREQMHGETDYARLYVQLYEDMIHFGEFTFSYRYPTKINGHYILDPSPIPRWDVPRLHQSPTINLFGAGREKRIYAVPPYCDADPLEFDDVAFTVERFVDEHGARLACSACGATNTFLDEIVQADGSRVWMCGDTSHCRSQRGIPGDL